MDGKENKDIVANAMQMADLNNNNLIELVDERKILDICLDGHHQNLLESSGYSYLQKKENVETEDSFSITNCNVEDVSTDNTALEGPPSSFQHSPGSTTSHVPNNSVSRSEEISQQSAPDTGRKFITYTLVDGQWKKTSEVDGHVTCPSAQMLQDDLVQEETHQTANGQDNLFDGLSYTLDASMLEDLEYFATTLEEGEDSSAEGCLPDNVEKRCSTLDRPRGSLMAETESEANKTEGPVMKEGLPWQQFNPEGIKQTSGSDSSSTVSCSGAPVLSSEEQSPPQPKSPDGTVQRLNPTSADDGYMSSSSVVSSSSATKQVKLPCTKVTTSIEQLLPSLAKAPKLAPKSKASENSNVAEGSEDDPSTSDLSPVKVPFRITVVTPEYLARQDRVQKVVSSSNVSRKLSMPSRIMKDRANVRERTRIRKIKDAFDILKEKILPFANVHRPPQFPSSEPRRLSQLETLEITIDYIHHLEELLDGQD